MQSAEIRSRFEEALAGFLVADRYLLEVDASERAIAHRLAVRVGLHFSDYDVDCEYNRDGFLPKRLSSLRFELDEPGKPDRKKSVLPDIVVHQRGESTNLLAVEIKKFSVELTAVDYIFDNFDGLKMKGYLDVEDGLGYAVGLLLAVPTKLAFELGAQPQLKWSESG